MKPVQERAFFSRLVLEWSDALVPQMHGDSPFTHNILKSNSGIQYPRRLLPCDRIEDIRRKRL